MNDYIDFRDPPPNRAGRCAGGKEQHLTEAAVMIAFAIYLFESGATSVEIHPDGEHGKRHDIKATLEGRGFQFVGPNGITSYGGIYRRGHQTIIVSLRSGKGDVVAELSGKVIVAECKGGIVNTRHAGQVSKLRRGLCEAVGLLMARSPTGERHITVVPATEVTQRLAERMQARALAAGIEIATVDSCGKVQFIAPSQAESSDAKSHIVESAAAEHFERSIIIVGTSKPEK